MTKEIDYELGYEVRGRTINAMEETIEELFQEIEELKVGRWKPIEDGIVFHETESVRAEWNYPAYTESIAFLEIRKKGNAIACGSMPQEDEHEVYLPLKVRLCRWAEVDDGVAAGEEDNCGQ